MCFQSSVQQLIVAVETVKEEVHRTIARHQPKQVRSFLCVRTRDNGRAHESSTRQPARIRFRDRNQPYRAVERTKDAGDVSWTRTLLGLRGRAGLCEGKVNAKCSFQQGAAAGGAQTLACLNPYHGI